MNVRNQQTDGPSLIRDSQKNKIRSLIVEHGSVTSIRVLSENLFPTGELTENAIFIPRSIEEISPWCFMNSKTLREVCFESNSRLHVIGESSFAASQLRSFFLPGTVYQIGDKCFALCATLSMISFGDFLWDDFKSWTAMSPNRVPKMVLRAATFQGSGLLWIDIPSRFSEIGVCCFQSCSSLFSIRIERGIEEVTISDRAFSLSGIEAFLPSDSSLVIDGKWSQFDRMLERPSETVERRLLPSCGFESSCLRKIIIWRGIQSIGSLSFQFCRQLCEVSFEKDSNLKRIESRAFSDSGLRSITLPRNVEFIGTYWFAQCPHLTG
jgi:hypothetical protein